MNKPPQLELSDVVDIKTMSRAELDKVPYTTMFWFCGVDRCCSKSAVRDYGIIDNKGSKPVTHEFYWPRSDKPWVDVFKEARICGRHWKMYRQFWKDQTGQAPKSFDCRYPVTKDQVPVMMKNLLAE